jgi:hypothetical protein
MYRDLDHAVEVVKSAISDVSMRDRAAEASTCVDVIRNDDAWFKAAGCLIT